MKKLFERIEDLVNLIEGLPLRNYAAPDAVQDVARKLQGEDADIRAAEFVREGWPLPGDHHYKYGYGILLLKGTSNNDEFFVGLIAGASRR
jgi:hypothetical protein